MLTTFLTAKPPRFFSLSFLENRQKKLKKNYKANRLRMSNFYKFFNGWEDGLQFDLRDSLDYLNKRFVPQFKKTEVSEVLKKLKHKRR